MTETIYPLSSGPGVGSVLVNAGVIGVSTFLWCAVPDYLDRRFHRVLVKIALIGVVVLPTSRTEEKRPGPAEHQTDDTTPTRPGDGGAEMNPWWSRLNPTRLALMVASVFATALTANIVMERGIYRIGKRLGQRGVAYPHTKVGLVLGAITGLAQLDRLKDTARRPRTNGDG